MPVVQFNSSIYTWKEKGRTLHTIIREQSIIRAFNYDQSAGSGMAHFF